LKNQNYYALFYTENLLLAQLKIVLPLIIIFSLYIKKQWGWGWGWGWGCA